MKHCLQPAESSLRWASRCVERRCWAQWQHILSKAPARAQAHVERPQGWRRQRWSWCCRRSRGSCGRIDEKECRRVLGGRSRYTQGMKSGGARPRERGCDGRRVREQTAGGDAGGRSSSSSSSSSGAAHKRGAQRVCDGMRWGLTGCAQQGRCGWGD